MRALACSCLCRVHEWAQIYTDECIVAIAIAFGEIQTWGYAQSTRVHSRATTGCLRFVRMLRMLVLCTPQHNPAHHAKSCNPVTVRELTHTRKSYFVACAQASCETRSTRSVVFWRNGGTESFLGNIGEGGFSPFACTD